MILILRKLKVNNYFEKHYNNCKENNLKVGAYWFSRDITYEQEKKFEYPIANLKLVVIK